MRKDNNIYVDVDRHESVSVGKLNVMWPSAVSVGDESDDISPFIRWCHRYELSFDEDNLD